MTVADLVRDRVVWPARPTLLDFGCGCHGNVATELCDLAHRTVAADVSPDAVAQFNRQCSDQGLHPQEVSAVLSTDLFADRQFENYFDFAVASLVWHHIDSSERTNTARLLLKTLKPDGGTLFIIDLDSSADDSINGVTTDELTDCLSAAGFGEIHVDRGPRISLRSGKKTMLLVATGKRGEA